MLRSLSAVGVLTLAIPLILVSIAPALAADDTTVALGGWYAIAQPYLLMAFSALVATILGFLTKVIHDKFGIDIQAKDREAIHRAAMTGIASGLALAGKKANEVQVDVRSPLIKSTVDWIQRSVPDATKRLGVTPEKLEKVALAKLGELQNGAVAPPAQLSPRPQS